MWSYRPVSGVAGSFRGGAYGGILGSPATFGCKLGPSVKRGELLPGIDPRPPPWLVGGQETSQYPRPEVLQVVGTSCLLAVWGILPVLPALVGP